jgi:hypothetical protein
MKKHHLRKEKNCLNCGATVTERFCSHCGQENTEPKETFGHLLSHFFADVTHYDSQLLTTLRDLIIRPGFLTREYNAGKRLSYLNPIRMYIFISAVFFLMLFSQKEEQKTDAKTTLKEDVKTYRQHLADSLRRTIEHSAQSPSDSVRNQVLTSLATKLGTTPASKADTGESLEAAFNDHGAVVFKIAEYKYKSIADYNAKQAALPNKAKDGAVNQYLSKKIIKMAQEAGNGGRFVITKDMAHDIPKIMFIFLPLFALIVRFFYSGKKFVFTQHAIFSLHFHSFLFLILMVLELTMPLFDGFKAIIIAFDVSLLLVFVYLAAALHNAYQQAIWLSVIKAFGISFLYLLALTIGMVAIFAAVFVFA